MNNFDLRKFLKENKLTSNSKLLKESEYEPGSIAPADLYYSDKHGKLVAMDDVDDKYHDSLELVYHKGDEIEGPMDEKLERSPDDRKPENLKLDPDYDKGGKYYSEDGAKAFRIQPFKQNDIEYTKNQAMKQGKHIVGLEGGELKKFISDYMAAWEADKGDTAPGKTFKEGIAETMNNFNLRKFLTENNLTTNSRQLNEEVVEDADYSVEQAFRKFGVDITKDVIVAEMDGGTAGLGGGQVDIGEPEPAALVAKRLEKHRLATVADYKSEESDREFPVSYEDGFYGDYTPEGTEHKLTYSVFEGVAYDIFQ